MTDPFDALAHLDEPRPLPPALRERLETALLQDAGARPLDAALTERLTSRMTDQLPELLADLDAPRPLPPAVREALLDRLQRRRDRRPWVAAAAVLVVASAAAVLVSTRPSDRPEIAASDPIPSASPSSLPTSAGTSAGSGAGAVALPAAPAPATPAPSGQTAVGAAASSTGGGAAAGAGGASAGLDAVVPDAGPLAGGTVVRLRGEGLRTTRAVTFGDAAATDVQVQSDGSVTLHTPAVGSARAVTVVVQLQDGSTVSRARGFSYLAPPRLDGADPGSGPSAGGTWVFLDGSALSRTASVRFGQMPAAEFTVVSDTRVRARAPQHVPGPVDITVTTPGGSSNAVRYLYLP